jgi:hypothetical protein
LQPIGKCGIAVPLKKPASLKVDRLQAKSIINLYLCRQPLQPFMNPYIRHDNIKVTASVEAFFALA